MSSFVGASSRQKPRPLASRLQSPNDLPTILRWGKTKETGIFPAELCRAFIPDTECNRRRIPLTGDQQGPGMQQPDPFLILERTERRHGLEVAMER